MNKQELIERIGDLKNLFGNKTKYIEIDAAIELVSKLNEPQKPVVPQFVADWLSKLKSGLFGLNYDSVPSEIYDWVYATEDNLRKLHLAFVYGYEVEKEKQYTVKIKAVNQYLVKNPDEEFLGFLQSRLKSKFTRKELEDAGFGWGFDCEGIEIEEVQE